MSVMVLGDVIEDTVTAHKDFYGIVKKVSKKYNNCTIVLKRLWEMCIQSVCCE